MPRNWQIGLGKRLRLAHMAFSRAIRLELAKENVSFGQFVHLERLWEEDGLAQQELSNRVGVEMASSTKILSELESLGFIKRKKSLTDGRVMNVYLTPRGAALQPSLLARAAAVNARARRVIPAAKLKELYILLEDIAAELNEAYPSERQISAKQRLDR